MQINLVNKLACIFGLNATGKTTLAKHIAQKYNTIIFDVLGEYDSNKFDVYVPKSKEYPDIAEEFEKFISFMQDNNKYNLIIVEEASRIFPNRIPLKPKARAFLDTFRHKNKGLILIARRPSQLFTDFVELSHYLFVFNLKGLNDISYFNKINYNLQDIIATLKPYHFVVILPNRDFVICEPVEV